MRRTLVVKRWKLMQIGMPGSVAIKQTFRDDINYSIKRGHSSWATFFFSALARAQLAPFVSRLLFSKEYSPIFVFLFTGILVYSIIFCVYLTLFVVCLLFLKLFPFLCLKLIKYLRILIIN